jgi:hypothetical protein
MGKSFPSPWRHMLIYIESTRLGKKVIAANIKRSKV